MKPLAYYLQIGAAIGSLYVGLIYLFYNWSRGLFHRLLGTNFIIMSLGLVINFIAINNYFNVYPHLSRTGFIVAFLMPPILYLSIFKGLLKKPFQLLDIFHFLPVLIYIINYLPYFISSADEKLALLKINKIGVFQEGWLLPAYFVPIFNFLQTSFYFILFVRKINYLKANKAPKLFINFFYYFTAYLLLHYTPMFLVIFGYYDQHELQSWIPVCYALANTVFYLKVIATPEWLFNKFEGENAFNHSKSLLNIESLLLKIEEKVSPKRDDLNDSEKRLLKQFNDLCYKDSFFLQADFQQKNLAKALNCSEYKLRILIEKVYDLNFVELNNYLKIKYFLTKYRNKEDSWNILKMNVISEKLGYKSLNSFYLNFKKITGLTPGEFLFQTKENLL